MPGASLPAQAPPAPSGAGASSHRAGTSCCSSHSSLLEYLSSKTALVKQGFSTGRLGAAATEKHPDLNVLKESFTPHFETSALSQN